MNILGKDTRILLNGKGNLVLYTPDIKGIRSV